MEARVRSWSSRILSQEGKEVFIKSILQSIPTYIMSCFLLPKSLCEEFNTIIRNYWWKQKTNKKGIHWMNWMEVCKTKYAGGLGFRDMSKFNIALLCKQGWCLLKNTNTLAFQVLQAKYFPSRSFLESKQGHNSSFTWQSICATKAILERGLRWRVGNGQRIKLWRDPWIPNISGFILEQTNLDIDAEACVCDLIEEEGKQ